MTKVQTNSQGKVYITSGGKALLSSGGGDTIYLPNESGATINAGDKVLFTMGSIGTDTPTSINLSFTNTNFACPICFFDNSSFITSNQYSGNLYNKTNGSWTAQANNTLYQNWGLCGLYQFFSDNVISYYGDYSSYNFFSGVVTKDGKVVPNNSVNYRFIGKNGTYYYTSSPSSLCSWDINTNICTSLTDLGVGSTATTFVRMYGNKLIAQGSNGCKIYQFATASTLTLLATVTVSGSIIYATGLEEGDYVFVTDNLDFYKRSDDASTKIAHLYCYQVQSDYTLSQVTVSALSIFETENCYACYDNRNDVLAIGTVGNAFFYEFNRVNNTFSQINVVLNSLPSTRANIPYRVMMSPDKSTVAVYGLITAGGITNIYTLTSLYSRIVPNSAYNYDLVTSFTGFATGNTDQSGNYEISTVLPAVVDTTFYTNVEPDEIVINGGVL